jgi:hypothetical protein
VRDLNSVTGLGRSKPLNMGCLTLIQGHWRLRMSRGVLDWAKNTSGGKMSNDTGLVCL